MRSILLSSAVVLAAALPAHAAEFRPAPNQSFTVDLDTQTGNFSQWKAEDIAGFNALRTQVTFLRLGKDSKWAPSFHLSLVNGAERATFNLTGMPGKTLLVAQLVHWRDGKEAGRDLYLLGPEFGETFALDVDWSPDGLVTMTIRDKAAQAINGFERHQTKLAAAPSVLEVSGSTGEVVLKPLQLGNVGP